jgi:putative membrane protein
MRTFMTAFAVATGLVAGLAIAEAQSSAIGSEDRNFVMHAAQGSLAEVELGKLAEQRASSDEVRKFGQRMVTDHGKAKDEVAQLAQQKGLTPPKDLDTRHRQLRDRLAKLSGAEFDRAYLDEMLKDHRKDVAEFKKQAEQAKDSDVKAWAAKTLPTLQEHLRMVEGLSNRLKGVSRN